MAVADILNGPMTVWYGPVGETPPDDDVAFGADLGGNWEQIAYTQAPLSASYEQDELDIEVEQELTALDRVKTAERFLAETVLSEITSANMAIATSGTATTTAAGAGQVGKDELIVGGEYLIDKHAWIFEGRYTDSSGNTFPTRIIVWKATAMLNGAQEYAKAGYPGIPIQIKALVDTSKASGQKLFKMQRITAEATS